MSPISEFPRGVCIFISCVDVTAIAFFRAKPQFATFNKPIICQARVSIDGRAWWHKAIARICRQGGQIVNPNIAILALGFLLLIGAALIAGGFGFHFPKD
jgi:hypothetical protein